ncbi:MAG: MurR/RpiR family transcriptional regulator, partial [Ideonella sp.]|nr:MurR/RpiR family transcriptional regulator [Ideonella sp.]
SAAPKSRPTARGAGRSSAERHAGSVPADRGTGRVAADRGTGSLRLTRRYGALTQAQQRLGDYVLAHRFEAATLAIDALARRAGVSVASANRFARALGYAAWAEFRRHWQAELRPQTAPLDRLERQQRLHKRGSAAERVRAVLHDAQADLQRSAADADDAALQAVGERLLAARRVAVFGAEVSAHLGGYFASYLGLFRPDVINLAAAGGIGEPMHRLLDLGADDLLVLLSLPRYSAFTLELAAFARSRGVAVVAITDAPGAPLAAAADMVLYAPAAPALLPASGVSVLALLEGLCAAVAARSPRRPADLAALMDALAPHRVGRGR